MNADRLESPTPFSLCFLLVGTLLLLCELDFKLMVIYLYMCSRPLSVCPQPEHPVDDKEHSVDPPHPRSPCFHFCSLKVPFCHCAAFSSMLCCFVLVLLGTGSGSRSSEASRHRLKVCHCVVFADRKPQLVVLSFVL